MFCHKKCINFLKMGTDCPTQFLGTLSHKKLGRFVQGTDRPGDVHPGDRTSRGRSATKIKGTDCHWSGLFGDGSSGHQ
jgi:hypothetical protein